MDDKTPGDKRLEISINAVKNYRAKKQLEDSNKIDFCGAKADLESVQSALNELEPDARSKIIELDACHRFTDRIHKIMEAAFVDDEPNHHLKEDAKSLALEWGGVVGMEDLIEDEYDESEGLDWVNEKYLRLIHKQKEAYSKLFDKD